MAPAPAAPASAPSAPARRTPRPADAARAALSGAREGTAGRGGRPGHDAGSDHGASHERGVSSEWEKIAGHEVSPAREQSAGQEAAPSGREETAGRSGGPAEPRATAGHDDLAGQGDTARRGDTSGREAPTDQGGTPAHEDTTELDDSTPRLPTPAGQDSTGQDSTGQDSAGEAPTEVASARAVPAEPARSPARPSGARPGDVAREALRAARARSEAAAKADAETAAAAKRETPGGTPSRPAEGARPPSRPAPRLGRPRRDVPVRRAGVRQVGELLADAFRAPTASAPSPRAAAATLSPTAPDTGSTRSRSIATPPAEPDAAPTGAPPVRGTDLPADPHPAEQAEEAEETAEEADERADPPATPGTATPLLPGSMAAPRRDGELRRTFPALTPPPPAPAEAAAATGLAETWWGNAWITALEEDALDAARLARGRGYAEQGHVDAITVTPGLVLGYVQGSRPRPYRAQVRLRTLSDTDWDRFLEAATDRPGHIAALLDKELPQSLADCGVPLLPGPGDLEPHCNCPDRGHPCKHAAALCYQTARLLDADPFVLLLLRGRGERELLDALSRLSAARAARAAQERGPEPLPGVRATDAVAHRPLPLPPPLPPPPHPEQPPAYPAAPGSPDPFALDQLATDAAARAHALLTTGRDPVGGLTLWQDAVRLAAARPGSGLTAATRSLYASLASAAGRTPAELARAVAAWRQGGEEGLAALEEPWDPPAGRFDRARPLLLAAGLPAFRPWRNRLTHPSGRLQLRLGRDGLWYAYESEPGHDDWWPRGTADLDPVGALTALTDPDTR
ncbi:SWIM zinc finger family protein [Streptomyces sp. NPDC047017]|uniref:SWIM zinc finger family protein n=1 Tax=Streptomyces sp. NPDC047017 TaxID=3155024 RepID=UPI0033E4D8DA